MNDEGFSLFDNKLFMLSQIAKWLNDWKVNVSIYKMYNIIWEPITNYLYTYIYIDIECMSYWIYFWIFKIIVFVCTECNSKYLIYVTHKFIKIFLYWYILHCFVFFLYNFYKLLFIILLFKLFQVDGFFLLIYLVCLLIQFIIQRYSC